MKLRLCLISSWLSRCCQILKFGFICHDTVLASFGPGCVWMTSIHSVLFFIAFRCVVSFWLLFYCIIRWWLRRWNKRSLSVYCREFTRYGRLQIRNKPTFLSRKTNSNWQCNGTDSPVFIQLSRHKWVTDCQCQSVRCPWEVTYKLWLTFVLSGIGIFFVLQTRFRVRALTRGKCNRRSLPSALLQASVASNYVPVSIATIKPWK